MKKKFKALMTLLIAVQMIFGGAVNVFADDEDDDINKNGTPKISVINGPVYDVDAGKNNEVKIVVKNLSSAGAKSVVVLPKINEIQDNPLKISLNPSDANFSVLQPNASKTLTFNVDVDKAAEAKTYSVDVKFSCFNQAGVSFDTTSTIYFKVKNLLGESSLSIEKITVDPDNLEVGGSARLNIAVKNKGSQNLYNTEVSLSDLDSAGVSAKGMSIKNLGSLQGGIGQTVTFDILANSALSPGNYPVTINISAKDENGREQTATQKFYVAVGGSSSGKKSDLEIRNLKEPGGSYGVNQNFNISFDVFNKGDATAKDIKVSAKESGEGGGVVPKSTSVISINELAPNAGVPVSFTFASTSAAATKNYTIELTLEYVQNGKTVTSSQYAGVNVSNPDADGKASKPKIIVSQYTSNPLLVQAGEEFDLTMSFLNTHPEKAVKNVKMFLTLAEEKSTDSQSAGNIFTPVNSSNTFYFDSIQSKATVNKELRLYVVPEAQPKTYTLTVNFEYEDTSGNEYTATELLGINVTQSTKLETSEVFIPESTELYMPISLYFDIYNTGKVDISNLKVEIQGDVETSNKSTYIGNCAKGESAYYEGSFSLINEGDTTVKLVLVYDNPSGERVEDIKEYTITGMPPMPMEEFPEGEDMGQGMMPSQPMGKGLIAGIVGGVIVAIIAAVIIIKKIKVKRAAKFIEDDEEEQEVIGITEIAEEGTGMDEQL